MFSVTKAAISQMTEHTRLAHPLEACGLLFGEAGVDRAVACRNVHPDPACHFEIDPQALIAAHKEAREGGDQLIGYYHSHPRGSPFPSDADRAAASGDGRVWAILARSEACLWRDGPSGFVALSYEVVEG